MHAARYSPDGAFVAYTRGGHGNAEIWIHESPPAARASSEGLHSKRGRCGRREARSSIPTTRRRAIRVMRRARRSAHRTAGDPRRRRELWLAPFSASRLASCSSRPSDDIRRLDLAHPGLGGRLAERAGGQTRRSRPMGAGWPTSTAATPRSTFDPIQGPEGLDGRRSSTAGTPPGRPTAARSTSKVAREESTRFPCVSSVTTSKRAPSRVISDTGFGEIIRNYDTKPVGTGFVATERRKDPSKFTVVVHFDRLVEERGGAALASARLIVPLIVSRLVSSSCAASPARAGRCRRGSDWSRSARCG